MIGSTVGPYRIVARLGEGGMGEVFRARDDKLNRDVALKVLRAEFAADPARLQRLLREAQALATLSHSNIAQVYGLEGGTDDGATPPALVMELVEGEDLANRIARGPLAIDEAVAIARQIADALEAAHEVGIVHRDLKPANIKIRRDGTVKVLDFGLAKDLSAVTGGDSPTLTTPAMTLAGAILGTAAYMSPEQARGKPVDKRADIWAFGVVLYEMLTGRRGFDGETVTDVLAAVVAKPPDWGALPPELPRPVRLLLQRCLERDPRLRLRDIGEARVTLASLSPADLGEAREEPGGAARARRSTWLPWAITAVVAIAAIAAFALQPAPDRPPRRIELALPADSTHATLSPNGRHIAFRSPRNVRVLDLDRGEVRDVASAMVESFAALAWSPDSAFIAYSNVDRKLWSVPVSGGPASLLASIPETGQLLDMTWRRDRSLVIAVWRGGLYTVPASGGDPTPLLKNDPATEIDFHAPVALDDGRIILAAHLVPGQDGAPFRVELVGGSRRETLLQGGFQPVQLLSSGHLLVRRSEVNTGLWAIPFTPARPLNVEEGVAIAPGATRASSSNDGLLLYGVPVDVTPVGEMVWVDRTGKVVAQIGPSLTRLTSPRLSPSRRQVVFSAEVDGNVDVWMRDLDSGLQSRITSESVDDRDPVWFPDGRRFAYFESSGPVGTARVIVRDITGGRRVEVAVGGRPTVSPDGRHLLYVVDERGSGRLRIATIATDGSIGPGVPFFKTAPEPVITGVSVAPAGNLIAYVEPHPGGRPELYVTRFPSPEGRWHLSSGGRVARWSDTGELFYMEGTDQTEKRLMTVRIEAGPTLKIGTPLKLFDVPEELGGWTAGTVAFDVAADGDAFLMVRSRQAAGAGGTRWILAENWAEQLPALTRGRTR